MNTNFSLKYYLEKHDPKQNEENSQNKMNNDIIMKDSNDDLFINKYEKIKEYSTLLCYIYEIFENLLSNLLSSHVDHYRDESVIHATVTIILNCINYLFDIYSNTNGNSSNENILESAFYIQTLFESALSAFRKICLFNTTIKLNFKYIIQHLINNPKYKFGMMFLLNFMIQNVNNETTVENFVDYLNKILKNSNKENDDDSILFETLDNFNKIKPLSLNRLIIQKKDTKNILQYIIEIGIKTNNDYLLYNAAQVLLGIFKRYVGNDSLNVQNNISITILNYLTTSFNKISKVNCNIFEEKDYVIYVPELQKMMKILKFLTIFLKSDYKFLFIYHKVTEQYRKIFSFFKEYLNQNLKTEMNENLNDIKESEGKTKLKQIIFDILFIILEGIKVLMDSKRTNNNDIYYSSGIRYDLVEELPEKKDIIETSNECISFLSIFNKLIDISQLNNSNDYIDKIVILTQKIIYIFINVSSNYYGQNLLLPILSLSTTISKLYSSCKEYKIKNEYLYLLGKTLSKLVIILFNDLNFYENLEKGKNKDSTKFTKFVLTKTRFNHLIKILLNEQKKSNDENFILLSKVLSQLMEFLWFYSNDESDTIYFGLKILKNLLDLQKEKIEIINQEIKETPLPKTRKIAEKIKLINKYYDFYKIQGYGLNFPLEIEKTNLNIEDNNIYMNMNINNNEYNKNQINEFEKLLNWKKHRIFLSKVDTLNMRKNAFDIDLFIGDSMNGSFINEYDYYSLRKKYYFLNTDPFEKYCNIILNNELIFNTFCQISFIISSTVVNKMYLLSNQNEYDKKIDKLFFYNLDNIKMDTSNNLRMEKDTSSNNLFMFNINNNTGNQIHKIKKKINSKLNLFIYKSKYDKLITNTNIPNKVMINTMNNNNVNKDNIRYISKVSGGNLSTHVDNVLPGQKVVNLTYNNTINQNNQNSNNQFLQNNTNNNNINPNQNIQIENKENQIENNQINSNININNMNIINNLNNNMNENIQKQNNLIHSEQNQMIQKDQTPINSLIQNTLQPQISFPGNPLIKMTSGNQNTSPLIPNQNSNPIMTIPRFVNPQNQFNNPLPGVMNNLINSNFVNPINNMFTQFNPNNFPNLMVNTNPNMNNNVNNGNLNNGNNLNNIIPPINNQNLINNIPIINNNNNQSNSLVSNLGNILMQMKNNQMNSGKK